MKSNNKYVKLLLKYVVLTMATIIYAAGISLFEDPNQLAPGGVSGLSIVLSRVIPFETSTIYFAINIPILILGMWKFGWRFITSTLYVTGVASLFMKLFEQMEPLTRNPLLAALAGSSLVAFGVGVVFKCGATTGGSDIIIKVLRLRFKHLKTGVLFFISDAMIVSLSGFVFKDFDTAMYAGIAIVVNAIVLDIVLYGTDGAKLIYIISDEHKPIADRILKELDIGATYLEGTGAYTKNSKQVIMCVVKKQVAPKAIEIVKEEDPTAFLIVTSATEIFGEGYKSYYENII